MVLPTKILLALLPFFLEVNSQASGSGKTTRCHYPDWDCCKASCGWTKKISLASGSNPVVSCDRNDNPLTNYDAPSGCQSGGSAYMCSNQSPWAVSETLAYGFAATSISGGNEASWCCACYEMTFTSGPVAGKKMIVQSTNTGGDLGANHFDLAMPGGGFGIFNGCTNEWGTPSTGWGQQYGGIATRSQCDAFPAKLKAGCYWRFDWFQNADNPDMTFKQVACPAALTAKSGCVRANDVPTGPSSVSTWTSGAGSVSTSSAKPSTTSKGTTSSTKSTTAAGTTSAAPGGATVEKWGQCGGIGYTGSTQCVEGTTCTFSGDYYSQCL
ncbi:RlpA-like double-psi beta-barrel-protein domain-containing protein-containing protein [Rhexocercosporidium sp. MPI-PUGE-AT-0058]|nr:RlpA-like double-psi beta-barrel-protein domain-containing protein-containing protein [Rhexocercosporidium sp. MPI-PUGE-AT-0058]